MEEQEISYPWHEAPNWAKWAAVDQNGDAHWYENKPIRRYSATVWGGVLDGAFCNIPNYKSEISDWKRSLQKNPTHETTRN